MRAENLKWSDSDKLFEEFSEEISSKEIIEESNDEEESSQELSQDESDEISGEETDDEEFSSQESGKTSSGESEEETGEESSEKREEPEDEFKTYFCKHKARTEPHEPIYQEFVDDEEIYDLDDIYYEGNIMWKKYRDLKGKIDKNIEISENGDIKKNGTLVSFRTSKNDRRSIYNKNFVHDMVASTFLKLDNDILFSVHKSINSEEKKRKYEDQSNNYKNLKWIRKEDLKNIVDNKYISKYGDFYSLRDKYYLLTEEKTINGLKCYDIVTEKGKNRYYLHKTCCDYFNPKLDDNYKFYMKI